MLPLYNNNYRLLVPVSITLYCIIIHASTILSHCIVIVVMSCVCLCWEYIDSLSIPTPMSLLLHSLLIHFNCSCCMYYPQGRSQLLPQYYTQTHVTVY